MAIETVLLFDTETTGTDPAKDQVVEAAGLLVSAKHASFIAGFTYTIHATANPAAALNGIPAELLAEHGGQAAAVWDRVAAWMQKADAVMAHNAGFDRAFCPQPLQGLRPWICSQDDVDWPRASGSRGLVDICLAHGVGISRAHRALADVMNMATLLERVQDMGTPVGELLSKAMRPKRRYRAVTGKYDPALNARLKEHGFRWDGEAKAWWKRLVVEEVPQLMAQYPFAVAEWPEVQA